MTTITDYVSGTFQLAIKYLKHHVERISGECVNIIRKKSDTSVLDISFTIGNLKVNENGLSIYVNFNGLTTHQNVIVTIPFSGFWIHVQNFNMLNFQGVFTMADFIHRWNSLSLNAEIRTLPFNTYTMDQFIGVFSVTLMQSLFNKRFSATTSTIASPASAILSTAHTPLDAHVSPLYSFVSEPTFVLKPTSAPTSAPPIITVSQANTCTKDLSESDENVTDHWTKYMKATESLDSIKGSVDNDNSEFNVLGPLDALFEDDDERNQEDEKSTREIGKKRTLDQISKETKEKLRQRIAKQNANYRDCISP